MKKSIKSVLAKSLAVAMAFSLAGIAPNTSSDAAAKKPTITKKVSVTVGKTKTVKVTSKKKVKKTTWSLTKAGKKVVSLSKKKAKSVVVKGKKAGKATLTAKIKVGKKTYKKTCKITVTKKKVIVTSKPTVKPTTKPTVKPTATPEPTEAPVGEIKTDNGTYTVDEAATYHINLTELNETTFTCGSKRSDGEAVTEDTTYNDDGSVTFTSSKDYNSGVSYYINPVTNQNQIIDISDTRGDGFFGYDDGTKDMSAYDYIRVKLTSENEMNFRTYNGNDQLRSAGFPGSATSETYEGGWIHNEGSDIWEADSTFSAGNTVKAAYKTRTVFIPITTLMAKGMNPETLTAVAMCPQAGGAEVTIHSIDFVKVKYEKPVTALEVSAAKSEIAPGKTTTVTAAVTPADATRQIVKWKSSDENIATVNFAGTVSAKKGVEGKVTITATTTDGSNISASKEIIVKEPSEDSAVIESHKMDLNSADIVATTNTGSTTEAAAKSDKGIEFGAGASMVFVDFSAYLATKNLDLSNYNAIETVWEVQDADGKVVTDYAGNEKAPGYGKIAYVPVANLNGYGDGIDVNYEGEGDTTANKAWLSSPYTGETCVLTIAKTNPAELATVAGFNLQLEKLPDNMHIVLKSITFVK